MELGQVIADRTFELHPDAGEVIEIVLRVGSPRPAEVDWVCPFEITGGDTRVAHAAWGVDAVQALLLALAMAAADLRSEARRVGARVQWLGRDELGLPGANL